MNKKYVIKITLLFCSILFFLFLIEEKDQFWFQSKTKITTFQRWNRDLTNSQLISIDLIRNEEFTNLLSSSTGTNNWSNDGRYLATGCFDKTKICIYETNRLFNITRFLPIRPLRKTQEIDLPRDCTENLSTRGVNSISWSNDGKRLVVCENRESSNTCIIGFDGTSTCWGGRSGDDIFSRADWSPTKDIIVLDTGLVDYVVPSPGDWIRAIRTGRNLQIVDSMGNVVKELIDGWSPEWSPDGAEIAFFRWDDERGYNGIGSIQPDGTKFRWIYRPPKRGSNSKMEYVKPIFLDSFSDCSFSSKISWSNDKSYLLVSASYLGLCNPRLFKVDINSGETVMISSETNSFDTEPSIRP